MSCTMHVMTYFIVQKWPAPCRVIRISTLGASQSKRRAPMSLQSHVLEPASTHMLNGTVPGQLLVLQSVEVDHMSVD